MKTIATELETIIDRYLPVLQNLSEDDCSYKPSISKWSKKEVLGHMIDSAQNNIRRFIAGQYEEVPFIVYNQDKWVAIAGYHHYDLSQLINLWHLLNRHICHILRNMPYEMALRKCQTEDLHTLEWLAQDYIKHLLHHLHQVLNMEPVNYP